MSSLSQDPIQDTLHLVFMFPKASLGCDSFSGSPCFEQPWQFWEPVVRSCAEHPSAGIFLMRVFSLLDWECFRKTPEVKYHLIASYRKYTLPTWFTTWRWPWPPAWCSSTFSTEQLPSPLSILYSLEASHFAVHTKGVGAMFPLFEGRLFTDIIWNSVEICLFSPFVIYISTDSFILPLG